MVDAMLDVLPASGNAKTHYGDRLRHANSQSQRQRIRWLIERASTADDRLADHARSVTARLVGWRNDHTHLGSESTTPPLDDLLLLNEVLSYVIEANILLDLGISEEDARYCLAHGYVWDDPIPIFLKES